MKIALLSDIHSNVYALQAVIEDAKSRAVDLMVNLGDILYGPIAPKASYELLMQHDFVTISGNQDRQIHEASAAEISSNPTLSFIIDELGQEPLEWLKSLAFDQQLNDDIYLCHGTPSSDLIYLLEDVQTGSPCLRSDQKIIELLGDQRSNVICCGHTHIPRLVSTMAGPLIINPGSVGLQAYSDDEPTPHAMENYNPQAAYAVIEKGLRGWEVEHIRVPYDVDSAVADCQRRGRLDWATYLATGRQ